MEKKPLSESILNFLENNLRWLLPVVAVVAAVLTMFFFFSRSDSPKPRRDIYYITAEYSGDTKAGTVLDSDNPGFSVTAHYKDGSQEDVSGWTVIDPVSLENASESTVLIVYEGCSTHCTVQCSTGYITAITAEYDGSTEAGTSLDNDNPGIHVFAIRSTGEKAAVEHGWRVVNPVILKKNSAATVQIAYEDRQCTLTVLCSTRDILRLTAIYNGSTEEGVFIGSGCKDLEVTAYYSDQDFEKVTGWTLSESVTLKPRERALLEVHYQDAVCTVEVTCTTPTREEYISECSEPGYVSLRYSPNAYNGSKVSVSGTITKIHLLEDGTVLLTLEVPADLFGLVKKPVAVRYTSTLHGELPPEGTAVAAYGISRGLYDSSPYEELMSAPLIDAEYVIAQENSQEN